MKATLDPGSKLGLKSCGRVAIDLQIGVVPALIGRSTNTRYVAEYSHNTKNYFDERPIYMKTPKANESLCQLLAPYFLGDRELKSLIEWAVEQLVEGKDTPSLRILAGLSGNDSWETEFYLKRTFQELGLPWPEEKDCLLWHCAAVARRIVAGTITPTEGYNRIYRIARHLDYPRELLRWVGLDSEFYAYQGARDEKEQIDKCIEKEAHRFFALLTAREITGVFRLTIEQSFKFLRDAGWDAPEDASGARISMPSVADEKLGLSFFRTSVKNQQFDYLTIPRTFFGRSEFKSILFESSDLSESWMCWNDWHGCTFTEANLSGCDMRRSVFVDCSFRGADLTRSDLRGTLFERCSFRGALMKGARLEKQFGLSRRLKAKAINLSPEQIREIDWARSPGEEPPGG